MPNKPIPQEVTVDPKTTALLVLDLNCRCENPEERCNQLIDPVAKFLDRARQAGMFIVYTAADRYQGTPEGRMPYAFKQRDDEPVIFPPAFDKFYVESCSRCCRNVVSKPSLPAALQAIRRSCTRRQQPLGPSVTPASSRWTASSRAVITSTSLPCTSSRSCPVAPRQNSKSPILIK